MRDHRAQIAQAKKAAQDEERRLSAALALEYKLSAAARLRATQDAAEARRRQEVLFAAVWGARAAQAMVTVLVRGRWARWERARKARAVRRIIRAVREYQLRKHSTKYYKTLLTLSFKFSQYVCVWQVSLSLSLSVHLYILYAIHIHTYCMQNIYIYIVCNIYKDIYCMHYMYIHIVCNIYTQIYSASASSAYMYTYIY